MSTPWVKNVVVCDLVRQELGGKFLCVGIYPAGHIALTNSYSVANLSFYVELIGRTDGPLTGHLRIMKKGQLNVLVTSPYNINTQKDVAIPLYTNPLSFAAQGDGEYILEWSIVGRWAELAVFTIVTVSANALAGLFR